MDKSKKSHVPSDNPRHPHKKLSNFCKNYDLSYSTGLRLIRTGKLKAFKIGNATIVDGDSIADYFANRPFTNGMAA